VLGEQRLRHFSDPANAAGEPYMPTGVLQHAGVTEAPQVQTENEGILQETA
jgi:hypothetical protein